MTTQIHSQAEIAIAYLIGRNVGTDPDAGLPWPLYYDAEPIAPDNCVTIYDTEGTQDGRDMRTGFRFEHPGIQVRIRALTSQAAFAKAKEIATALDEAKRADVVIYDGENARILATRRGSMIRLGREVGKQRMLYTVNAILTLG